MRLILKIVLLALGLLLISAMDASFFPSMGGYISQMNFALALGLFLVVIFNEKIAFFVYIPSVVLTGLTSSSLLIAPLLLGGLTLLIINWLFETLFTNRSYYSLIALGIIGWFIYYLSFAVFTTFFNFLDLGLLLPDISLSWFAGVIISALITALLLTFGYLLTNAMSQRFKSYFVVYNR